MIDKTIGVIPPRNELSSFPDKKATNLMDHKSEFASILNQSRQPYKKLDKKEKSDQALGGTKKKVQDPDEKLADKSEKTKDNDNEKETQGVSKKKKQKLVNEEMVLGGMASIESANEIPDTEEYLDSLKETNLPVALETKKEVVAETTDVVAPSAEMNEVSDEALAALFDLEKPMPTLSDEAIEALVQESVQASPQVEVKTPMALAEADQVDPAVQLAISVQPQTALEAASEIVPDSKVLETLSREQMFQKLETMKKIEEPSAKTESRNTMEGISTTQAAVQLDTSDSLQSEDQSQDGFGQGDKEMVQLGVAPQHQSHVAKDFSAVAQAQINKPVDTQAAEEANLKEILNQAQYLVTKGGGEVSVKMTPEGLGEVQLKIMMENGKMNLEMNTHDKNVQKMIQDSLSDLKSSLAAHQISVEHVTLNNKINTVQDVHNTQSSQNFTDAHAHHQSEHSHQRDQRQQARQVFEHETMNAIPLAKSEINKASAHRVYQTHKANSLNAVA